MRGELLPHQSGSRSSPSAFKVGAQLPLLILAPLLGIPMQDRIKVEGCGEVSLQVIISQLSNSGIHYQIDVPSPP